MCDLTAPHFSNEEAARKFLEGVRWPDGPVCPHCGTVGDAYETKKPGRYRCGSDQCRKDFTVMVGSVFERSHIPLHKWLLASHLMASSKKRISAHQLHRMLGITYKSAWFMAHRIREAMVNDNPTPLGGNGGTVEADETYIGRKRERAVKPGAGHKHAVMALVERGGAVRSFHVRNADHANMRPIIREHISIKAHLMTDESRIYTGLGGRFARIKPSCIA